MVRISGSAPRLPISVALLRQRDMVKLSKKAWESACTGRSGYGTYARHRVFSGELVLTVWRGRDANVWNGVGGPVQGWGRSGRRALQVRRPLSRSTCLYHHSMKLDAL